MIVGRGSARGRAVVTRADGTVETYEVTMLAVNHSVVGVDWVSVEADEPIALRNGDSLELPSVTVTFD